MTPLQTLDLPAGDISSTSLAFGGAAGTSPLVTIYLTQAYADLVDTAGTSLTGFFFYDQFDGAIADENPVGIWSSTVEARLNPTTGAYSVILDPTAAAVLTVVDANTGLVSALSAAAPYPEDVLMGCVHCLAVLGCIATLCADPCSAAPALACRARWSAGRRRTRRAPLPGRACASTPTPRSFPRRLWPAPRCCPTRPAPRAPSWSPSWTAPAPPPAWRTSWSARPQVRKGLEGGLV